MVARNFSLQDISYSRLTTVTEEEEDDDRHEFATLQELKPHHLTEITQFSYNPQDSPEKSYTDLHDQEYNVYYDLNHHQMHSK